MATVPSFTWPSVSSGSVPCEVCFTMIPFEEYVAHLEDKHRYPKVVGDARAAKREHESEPQSNPKRARTSSSSSSSSVFSVLLELAQNEEEQRSCGICGCTMREEEYEDHVLAHQLEAPRACPLPKEEMQPGTGPWFVSPLDIRFTHDKIYHSFRPFMKKGEWVNKSILDSVQECLRPREVPNELETIDVVWHRNELYVAGSFNRRLCMYRLLAMFACDRYGLIPVQILNRDAPRVKFFKKLTTTCAGRSVLIRQSSHSVGMCKSEVNWPEALELFRRHGLCVPNNDTVEDIEVTVQHGDSCLARLQSGTSSNTPDAGAAWDWHSSSVGFCDRREVVIDYLRQILGGWHDSEESKYKVTEEHGTSLTVHTVRKNGEQRGPSYGMIHIFSLATGGHQIAWGKKKTFVLGRSLQNHKGKIMSLEWQPRVRDGRHKVFVWMRD